MRMIFRKWVCGGLALIVSYGGVMAASETDSLSHVTFEQALTITQENSSVLKQYKLIYDQKKQEQKAAKGLYFPTLSLSANYVQMSDKIHLDMTPVKNAITPLYEALANFGSFSGVPNPNPVPGVPLLPDNISTQVVREKLKGGLEQINATSWDQMIQKERFGMVSAGFSWALYTGGKISAANEAAQIKLHEATLVERQKSGEVICELVERYYGVCLARNVVQIRRDVYSAMQNHLTDAQKMFDQGIIPKAQLLHAKVFHAQAERELKKSERQLSIVNQALSNTMAISNSDRLVPVSRLFYIPEIESIDHFKDMARQKSPLLMQIESKKSLAHQKLRVERSAYFPTIAAMGTYDLANKDLSPYLPEYMVGVGLKWTLFDGVARTRKVKAAHLLKKQVQQIGVKASADIETAIEKYYQQVQMGQEQLKELETALEFASEYSKVREKAFHEGMSTSTQVVDARLVVAKVKIERLQAMYNFDVALAKLLQYSGQHDQFMGYQQREDTLYESYIK